MAKKVSRGIIKEADRRKGELFFLRIKKGMELEGILAELDADADIAVLPYLGNLGERYVSVREERKGEESYRVFEIPRYLANGKIPLKEVTDIEESRMILEAY